MTEQSIDTAERPGGLKRAVQGLLGAPLLVGLFFWRPSPLLILMALLAAPKVMEALRGFNSPEQRAYYLADAETRLTYALLYLGLAAFLAIMCHELHARLPRAF